ncbi:MAG: ribonuclease P protein component [Bacteroidota bacterium]|nr:ribonuclease P protein component [Bacteroidota bacterium]
MARNKINSLGKEERLKSRKQIDSLFERGRKITVFPFRLMYQTHPDGFDLKAGFTVSSRNFPRAVDRNRIKRLSREVYRLHKMPLQELLQKNKQRVHLFFIYTGREIPDFLQLNKSMLLLLDKLVHLQDEGNSSNT